MEINGIRLFALSIFLITFPSLVFAAKTHVVKKNDTLYSLSKKYHVKVQDLKSANNMVDSRMKPGDKLVIPPRTVTSAGDRDSGGTFKGKSYKIKKGDTLSGIARKTGVSVSELKRINGIRGSKLKPGKVISLHEAAPVKQAAVSREKSYRLRDAEIFSSREYERTLAELTDTDTEKPVELGENLELTTDASKMLKKSAFSFLGTRYRFGGNGRNGLDCSSFVQQVFRDLGINLPRTAREQFWTGEPVIPYDLQKGDLLFFRTYASFPSHVGIYLGENKMIHASSKDRKVVISSFDTPYYRSRFIGAKRHSKLNPDTMRLEDLLGGADILEESEEEITKNDTLGLKSSN